MLPLVALIGFAAAATRPLRDASFLWHVRAGEIQLDTGSVLTADPFSFTHLGDAWRTQSWLAELIYGRAEQLAGGVSFVGPMLFVAGVLVAVFVGLSVYAAVPRPEVVGVALVVALPVLTPALVPRPVVFSLILLAVIINLPGTRADWLIVPLIWVWAALHASFVFGIGIVVLEALRRRSGRLGGLALLGAVAATLTAHGVGVWTMLADFVEARPGLALINEWKPPELVSLGALPFLAAVLAVLIGAVSGKVAMRDLWVVAPMIVFGVMARRNLAPAFVVLLPFAMVSVGSYIPRFEERRAVVPTIVAAALIIASAAIVVVRPTELDESRLPVLPSAILGDGPVFHSDVTGGYLIYSHWPDRLVYIDDRAELHAGDVFADYVDTVAARPGWEEVLDANGITQVLLRSDDALADALERSAWVTRYADDDWVVMADPAP